MKKVLGAYPTMITPYKEDGSVDYETVKKYVHWYHDNGCEGIFAVCQSSEIFYLTPEEIVKINRTVYETAQEIWKNGGRKMEIVSSGIMANFHPALYSWMYEHQEDSRSERLSAYLGVTSLVEHKCYPIPAKRYLKEYVGLPIGDACRSMEDRTVPTLSSELHDIYEMTRIAHEMIEVPLKEYPELKNM